MCHTTRRGCFVRRLAPRASLPSARVPRTRREGYRNVSTRLARRTRGRRGRTPQVLFVSIAGGENPSPSGLPTACLCEESRERIGSAVSNARGGRPSRPLARAPEVPSRIFSALARTHARTLPRARRADGRSAPSDGGIRLGSWSSRSGRHGELFPQLRLWELPGGSAGAREEEAHQAPDDARRRSLREQRPRTHEPGEQGHLPGAGAVVLEEVRAPTLASKKRRETRPRGPDPDPPRPRSPADALPAPPTSPPPLSIQRAPLVARGLRVPRLHDRIPLPRGADPVQARPRRAHHRPLPRQRVRHRSHLRAVPARRRVLAGERPLGGVPRLRHLPRQPLRAQRRQARHDRVRIPRLRASVQAREHHPLRQVPRIWARVSPRAAAAGARRTRGRRHLALAVHLRQGGWPLAARRRREHHHRSMG